MKIDFEFTNLDVVVNNLVEHIGEQNAEQALGKACALLEREAKIKAPKDTGALRNSITSRIVNDGDELAGEVFTPLEYAPYVEFGTGLFAESEGRTDVPWCYQDDEGNWHSTSGMPPQPFMRPALDENRDEVVRILTEGLVE